ncbi:sperm-associated antigen 5 [Xenopus laevis]|uniref:Sperm-associated antigen 5 n=2 Tax=Xenopus laevis TaxID=8355 RepID=A0A1L8HD59_XENLA|nr:sperm-associated antigen 5 [Xenopus laevis]XP_018101613.1 sperm-associated antigen 5 [Xenopus laevis]XP_018101614.1 sperm-associated antigen 5 [Xenopus laevis]XP_018101615.1 sperm-associated antigen 5 [Xenopus laevis]OCT94039.1 hypothetical protein XELAEV_18011702mg [Xenopus laevis]
MWPLKTQISDENRITAMQTAQRKSLGRTPLQDLTAQSFTLSDQNNAVRTKLNLNKSPNLTVTKQDFKKNNSGNTGTSPVSIWVEPETPIPLMDNSINEVSASKSLKPISLFAKTFSTLNSDGSTAQQKSIASNNVHECLETSEPATLEKIPCLSDYVQEKFPLRYFDNDSSIPVNAGPCMHVIASLSTEVHPNEHESKTVKEETRVLKAASAPVIVPEYKSEVVSPCSSQTLDKIRESFALQLPTNTAIIASPLHTCTSKNVDFSQVAATFCISEQNDVTVPHQEIIDPSSIYFCDKLNETLSDHFNKSANCLNKPEEGQVLMSPKVEEGAPKTSELDSCNMSNGLANDTYATDNCSAASPDHVDERSLQALSTNLICIESPEQDGLGCSQIVSAKENTQPAEFDLVNDMDTNKSFQDAASVLSVAPEIEVNPDSHPTANVPLQQKSKISLHSLVQEVVCNTTFDLDCITIRDKKVDTECIEPNSIIHTKSFEDTWSHDLLVDCKTVSCKLLPEQSVGTLNMTDIADSGTDSYQTEIASAIVLREVAEGISLKNDDGCLKNEDAKVLPSVVVQSDIGQAAGTLGSFTKAHESRADSVANTRDSLLQARIFDIPILYTSALLHKMTPKLESSKLAVGTCSTPTSTSSTSTWTTPIMLLNKSMNTSWEIEKGRLSPKDNASETDALLWNFSKESFNNASREELIDRLEGTLIVVEVLSRQLQGWQQNLIGSRPSEQRESSTQTCVTYTSTEDQYYHNMYVKTMERLQIMQRCNEVEKKLQEILKESADVLISSKTSSMSLIGFAENMQEKTHEDKAHLSRMVCQARSLIADHMTLLDKMNKKMQANQLQRDEMKTCMEKAIDAKDAADQCLEDLETHSSAVIAQLQRDLETEKVLCGAVKKAYMQQLSFNEELVDFAKRAHSVCSEMEEDRVQLQTKSSQARELLSQHWLLFGTMKNKTDHAVNKYESMKTERDVAYLENNEICNQLEDMKSQSVQLETEITRFSSELSSLMEQICTLQSENDHLKRENSEKTEELSAMDSSLKLLEKELNETAIREQESKQHNKKLSAETVPRLEQELSEALQQKAALQIKIQELQMHHTSQAAAYKESIEFLEQENHVWFEQVAETESQLKKNLFALRERNLQCETQKDTISELQSELSKLKEELQSTKATANDTLSKMGKEISDSSSEASKIRDHLLCVKEQLMDTLQAEVSGASQMPETPARGLKSCSSTYMINSTKKPQSEQAKTAKNAESLWSETSAFTVVKPVTSPTADNKGETLPGVICELGEIVSNFAVSSSHVIGVKKQDIEDLKREISDLKEKLQNMNFKNLIDKRDLMEEIEILKRKNKNLEDCITSKQQCLQKLEEIVNEQEQRLLQQVSKDKVLEGMSQENATLKRSLQQCESEVLVLKDELSKNPNEAARDWMQEKLLLHKDLRKLRLMLVDTENSKSELLHRAMRHRNILEGNLARSELELKKLDDIIEKIRRTLLSIPEVVSNCEELKQVLEYIN